MLREKRESNARQMKEYGESRARVLRKEESQAGVMRDKCESRAREMRE